MKLPNIKRVTELLKRQPHHPDIPDLPQEAHRNYEGYTILRASLGWRLLQEEVTKASWEDLTRMINPIPERERDVLSGKIQAYNWMLGLPSQKIKTYSDLLAAETDSPAEDSEGPVADPFVPAPEEE